MRRDRFALTWARCWERHFPATVAEFWASLGGCSGRGWWWGLGRWGYRRGSGLQWRVGWGSEGGGVELAVICTCA